MSSGVNDVILNLNCDFERKNLQKTKSRSHQTFFLPETDILSTFLPLGLAVSLNMHFCYVTNTQA